MPVRALLRRTLSSALSLTHARRSPRASTPSNRSECVLHQIRIGEHLLSSGSRIPAILILSGQHVPTAKIKPEYTYASSFLVSDHAVSKK